MDPPPSSFSESQPSSPAGTAHTSPLDGQSLLPTSSDEQTGNTKLELVSSGVDTGSPTPSAFPPLLPTPPAFEPASPGAQNFTFSYRVKPGVITDPERILSPCPLPDVSQRVEDMPLPADSEVREVFDEMIGGFGVPYGRLMAVIGGCMVCDQVMALPNIETHSCMGRAKNMGPCPSKHPLLPQHRRTLPTAGSRKAMELDMGQVALKADDDSDDGIECIGEIHSYAKNKRKKRISDPPSQHILIHMKKPRVEEVSGRSQTTPASSKQMRAASAIPTGSHFRIPTPEGSREVYRPADGEFIMYEMA